MRAVAGSCETNVLSVGTHQLVVAVLVKALELGRQSGKPGLAAPRACQLDHPA